MMALRDRDIYEAWEYMKQTNFDGTSLVFRESLYQYLWERSTQVTPTNFNRLMQIISTWLRIGVKPFNLFSEAFQLLPKHFSRESAVLCALY